MQLKRWIVLIAILGVGLAACGGKSKTFTAAQLGGFMLVQQDVPEGVDFVADSSGAQPLDELVSSDEEKTKLASLGFQAGHIANFANQSALLLLTGQGNPVDAEVISSIALIFKTADNAHDALVFEHERDLAKGTNMRTISVPNLGDETIGAYGTPDTLPFPGYLIYWRIGNTFFGLIIAGSPSALHVSMNEANSLAKIMNDRANR